MERLHSGPGTVSVEDLSWIPGRHGFHFEPDFCGRMNVVLDDQAPTRVAFSCDAGLVEGEVYSLCDGDGRTLRARITRSTGDRYTATVIPDDSSTDCF